MSIYNPEKINEEFQGESIGFSLIPSHFNVTTNPVCSQSTYFISFKKPPLEYACIFFEPGVPEWMRAAREGVRNNCFGLNPIDSY